MTGRHPQRHDGHRSLAEPRRFYPKQSNLLTLEDIRGEWRPSGTVTCSIVFAVIWTVGHDTWWAPLHDFEISAIHKLVDWCRAVDQEGNWRRSGRFT